MRKVENTEILVEYLRRLLETVRNLQGTDRAMHIIRGYIAVAKWMEEESDSARFSFIVSRELVQKLKHANETLTNSSGISANFDPDRIERAVLPVLVKALSEAEFILSLNCTEYDNFKENFVAKNLASEMRTLLE